MATCFCKQPCEKHKRPVIRTKAQALEAWENAMDEKSPTAISLTDMLKNIEDLQQRVEKLEAKLDKIYELCIKMLDVK